MLVAVGILLFRSTNSDEAPYKTHELKNLARIAEKLLTFKTKQRAAVEVPEHRARSRVRCTHSDPWRKEKRDPRSVPATTPRCPDNRQKFRVHGRKSVVSQNIMITAVVLRARFFPHLFIPYTSILYKVEGTQFKTCCFKT